MTYDVIIVGAGPTGLALAIELGDRGLRVAVLERHRGIYPLPRAVHLDDEVYRILHDLGVGDAFGAISQPARGMRLLDADHALLAQFERRSKAGAGLPQANMFDQPELERLLRDRVATLPTVELHAGVMVQALAQDPTGVVADTVDADEPTRGQTRFRGRFLVGCDGANSVVARHIGSRPEVLGAEQRWLVVDVRSERRCGDWNGVDQVCDVRRARTFMPVGPDRYRWEFQLLEHETPGDYADIPRLRPRLMPWIDGITDDELEVMRIAEYTFRARVEQRWRERRIFIAGDAAHLTPPFIGQGLGAGLRDAVNLGWKLARVSRGASTPDLLDSYAAERRPHAREMVRRAVLVGRAMTGRGLRALARRWLLPQLRHVPSMSAWILDSVTPPLTGPLIDSSLPRSVRGGLLPLVVLPSDAGEVWVDAALGRDFGIVADVRSAVDELARRLGVPIVRVRADAEHAGLRHLSSWLCSMRADYAVVRPDRTVLAAGRAPQGTPMLLTPPLLHFAQEFSGAPARHTTRFNDRQARA